MKKNKKPFKRSRHRVQQSKFLLLACITAALLCLVSVVIFVAVVNRDTQIEEPAPEEFPSPPEEEPSPSGNEPEAEKPPVVYPEPEYNLTIEEVYVPLEGLTREYRVAWVSDLHLITDHEPGGISDGSLIDVIKRYNNLSVTEDGVHAEDLWPDIVKALNVGNYDAVIFGGDMVDYGSPSNMDALKKGYDALRYDREQILYIRADHDYGAWYAGDNFTQWDIYDLHKELDGDDIEKKYLDMEEFVLIGINNSTQNIAEEYFPIVEAQYRKAAAEGKPIVAVTHVPYGSTVDPTLQTLSMRVRNKEYYWLGYWQPNEFMRRYLDFLFGDEPQAAQVLAGHLHAAWDGMITEKVRQHIFSPAFSGTIGVIHFVPEDADVDTSTYQSRKYYPTEN